MKRLCLFFAAFLFYIAAGAQTLKVKKDLRVLNSIEGKMAGTLRIDKAVTGKPCARLHVAIPESRSFAFEGKIEGDVDYKVGEAIVYLRPGASDITIKSARYGSFTYEFPQLLQSGKDYELVISIDRDKVRTLVMPVVAFGKNTSFGAMVGLVKKFGGYLKAHSDFHSVSNTIECTGQGLLVPSGEEIWFSGNTQKSRFAVTGGALCRLANPLYLYAGAGYGNRNMIWETSEGQPAKNIDASCKGIETELGLVGRINNIAVSGGVQSCQFKYWEAVIGVGFMF